MFTKAIVVSKNEKFLVLTIFSEKSKTRAAKFYVS